MNQRNKDEFEDKVGSWSERIGASIIGLLTVLGVGLIIYTGVKATTYEAPKSDQEYLTLEDTEVTTDQPVEEKPATEETTTEDEETQPETPVEEEQPETVQPEQPVVETPQTVEATCNIDGVNIRQEPQTGTTIIGQLISGEKITVLNRNYNDEWVQVSYNGQTGYVYFEYLDFN